MKDKKKNVGLIAAREASGKTQLQIAQEARVNERVYQNYEYGENEPRIRTAIRIALGIRDVRTLWGSNPTR